MRRAVQGPVRVRAGCQAALPPSSILTHSLCTQVGADSPKSFGQYQHVSVVVNPKQPPKYVAGASPRGLPGGTVQIHPLLMRDAGQGDELDFTPGDEK